MKIKNSQKILLGFFILIAALGIYFFIRSLASPTADFISSLSGASTFILALLTLAYVYITSKQLDVMAQQLNETKRDRELQNQPLPWINKVEICIEKPRVFYSPPEKNPYRTLARYFVYFNIKNAGSFPAISIDITASIMIPHNNNEIVLNAIYCSPLRQAAS